MAQPLLTLTDYAYALAAAGIIREKDIPVLMNLSFANSSLHPLETIHQTLQKLEETPYSALTLDELSEWLATYSGLKFTHLDPLKIDVATVTKFVSYGFANKHQVLVLSVDDVIDVVCADPFQYDWQVNLEKALGKRLCLQIVNSAKLRRHINEFYSVTQTIEAAKKTHNKDLSTTFEQWVELGKNNSHDANDQHVVRLVDWLLHYAIEQGASDVHLEPKRETGHIRFRLDGQLQDIYQMPQAVFTAMLARLKILSRMDVSEKRLPQNGRIKTKNRRAQTLEIRLSSLATVFGEKIVMRIFDPDVLIKSLESLGLASKDLEKWSEISQKPNGIILVTGPTGSGKTSTLYATLQSIKKPALNICTVEDPIEMIDSSFNQVQTQEHIGLNFSTVLKALMRQDPDVIMVGEIRDKETAEMAIQAALTGHLVFSTLHTNNAAGAVTRLLDLGVPNYLIRATLKSVLAQRLIRKLCNNCKKEVSVNKNHLQVFEDHAPLSTKNLTFLFDPVGCSMCRGTGFQGRLGFYELLVFSDQLISMINESVDVRLLSQRAIEEGMMPLNQQAIEKVIRGETSFDEIFPVLQTHY